MKSPALSPSSRQLRLWRSRSGESARACGPALAARLTPLLWAAQLLTACSVSERPSSVHGNECESSSECAEGASCAEHVCRVAQTNFDTLLLEVVTSASDPQRAQRSYLLPAKDPLLIPSLTRVRGTLKVDESTFVGFNCPSPGPDRFIGARVTASRWSTPFPELTEFYNAQKEDPAFSLDLPPDAYHLYIVPQDCRNSQEKPLPPVFIEKTVVGGSFLGLEILLAPPIALDWSILLPTSDPERRPWVVDMVQPSGQLISTVSDPLIAGSGAASGAAVGFNLLYAPASQLVPGDGTQMTTAPLQSEPLIRVRPVGDTDVGPTVYWPLGVDIDGKHSAPLDMRGLSLTPVRITGTAHAKGQAAVPVPGEVRCELLRLTDSPGLTVSYQRTAVADAHGSFSLDVIPGVYRVTVLPQAYPGGGSDEIDPIASTSFAIAESTVTLDQPKKLDLAVGARWTLEGTVFGGSEGLGSAVVVAIPHAAPADSSLLQGALARSPVAPHTARTTTAPDGHYVLKVDPGLFDLRVEPLPSSNYPWSIWRSVRVDDDRSLDLTLESPAILSGTVMGPGTTSDASARTVANATIRAFAGASTDATLLQIGESTSTTDGRYRLLLPSRFDEAP